MRAPAEAVFLPERAARRERTAPGAVHPVRHAVRALAGAFVTGALVGAFAAPTMAQEPARPPADTTPAIADTLPQKLPIPRAFDSIPGPGPGGAMLRSILLPGWGQAAYHAYFRGAVYYAGWAGAWFMNYKNYSKLDEIRQMRTIRRSMVLDSLQTVAATDSALASQLADPVQRDQLIGQDSLENDMRLVENSRKQQRQDWIALTLFWTLASGVDAFVTAHLADFPAVITTEPGSHGGVALRIDVPLGRRRR
jgi:hypothetical protein